MRSRIDARRKAAGSVGHYWPGVLRTALFLASLLVILEHLFVLEWLDVFMLRVLPTVAPHTAKVDRTKPAQALVFTIRQELFDTEFKSRSPIDRAVLLEYLRKLVDVYPAFKVLAIDYDLSPNDDPAEQEAQAELDTFLLTLIQTGRKVVLIKHLPVENRQLCELKAIREQDKYDKGIWFGDSQLLHYGLFGAVVKYAERQDSFPAIALAAANDGKLPLMRFTCDESAGLRPRSSWQRSTLWP